MYKKDCNERQSATIHWMESTSVCAVSTEQHTEVYGGPFSVRHETIQAISDQLSALLIFTAKCTYKSLIVLEKFESFLAVRFAALKIYDFYLRLHPSRVVMKSCSQLPPRFITWGYLAAKPRVHSLNSDAENITHANDLSPLSFITSDHQVEAFSSNCWVITVAMWLHWLRRLPAHATKGHPCEPQGRNQSNISTNDKGRPVQYETKQPFRMHKQPKETTADGGGWAEPRCAVR